MKTVAVLCFVLVGMALAQNKVHVVDNNSPDLSNVDSAFYRPTQGNDGTLDNVDPGFSRPHRSPDDLNNVDQAFYRPTVNRPNGGYEPVSTGPAYVENGPYQNGPPGYPYRPSGHPGARGGK